MTQNTEQNVRTREVLVEGLSRYLPNNLAQANDIAWSYINDAIILGAEEQRRKDAEGQEPAGWALRPEMRLRAAFSVWPSPMAAINDWNVPLYTRPANVAALEAERDKWRLQARYETDVAEAAIQKATALEARIASLKEAEQLARADAEASKARAEKLKKVALDVLQVCQRSKMGPSDLGYVTNMIRAALTREGGV